jgi:hypothetical protein
MEKRILFSFFIIFFLNSVSAQTPQIQGSLKELFQGPPAIEKRDTWIAELRSWRSRERKRICFNDTEYKRPELSWLKSTFIYAQMMAHDRFFYDAVKHKYTVNRYLNDLKKRYGGIDAVLIWPTYPNIGIDDRNQFDLVGAMPGGVEAVKQMIQDFKNRGVRVFFPIMIWDSGTRSINESMMVALVKEMKVLGADGLNGDTMWGVTEDFRNAYDSIDYPLVLQPEVAIKDLNMVQWNLSSWGYYWNYKYIPGVSIYKWLEPRHQVFETNRWKINKTNDLQYAFFNGVGYNAWENIWGIWNQVPERYAEAIRRIATIYRHFPGIWNSTEWEPGVPVMQKGVFASSFPGIERTVYTFVNRDSTDKTGKQIQLPFRDHMRYFDLWNGKELAPEKEGTKIFLSFPIESNGFGALLAAKEHKVEKSFSTFLDSIRLMATTPLNALPATWHPLPQQIIKIEKTRPEIKVPEGMHLVEGTANYLFVSRGVMIEGNQLPKAVGVQHPWEAHPSRNQKHLMKIPSFYMDTYPVTNAQYKEFLDQTHYYPEDDYNFLKDWKDGSYPVGWNNKPVTWVSIEDARAYAKWAGKRLPHEWEWQYAAQGNDNRLYPWGNVMDSGNIPSPDSGRVMRPPTAVNAYPQGKSPFGIEDMVGNVWQWTDVYEDEHTRSAILKGGGYYRATTSKWYFPRVNNVTQYGKYLLMAPSLDRSGAIGFRCVVDK